MLVDRYGDVITTSKLDSDGKTMVIHKEQDITEHLKANAEARANDDGNWQGDFHHVASIPFVVLEEMNKEAGCNLLKPENRAKLVAMLNNKDYLKLRTKEGRI